MEISRDAYRAIEDIVGTDNVTDDPALLDSYAFEVMAETVRPNQSHFMPRPWAVVLPGSTEEVAGCHQGLQQVQDQGQADLDRLVPLGRAADRQRADRPVRPAAHGQAFSKSTRRTCSPSLNRMSSGAQLQAEVMKRGLNLNIIGAGCSTSIVASACAYSGSGPVELLHGQQFRESSWARSG